MRLGPSPLRSPPGRLQPPFTRVPPERPRALLTRELPGRWFGSRPPHAARRWIHTLRLRSTPGMWICPPFLSTRRRGGCLSDQRRDPLAGGRVDQLQRASGAKPAAACSGRNIPAASKRRVWLGPMCGDLVIALRSNTPVSQYTCSKNWDTRVAVADAIGAIAENVKHTSLMELCAFCGSKKNMLLGCLMEVMMLVHCHVLILQQHLILLLKALT